MAKRICSRNDVNALNIKNRDFAQISGGENKNKIKKNGRKNGKNKLINNKNYRSSIKRDMTGN